MVVAVFLFPRLTPTFPSSATVAIAILSGYGGLIVLYKISTMFSSKKKVEEKAPAPVAAAPASSEGIPSVDSPEFDSWVDSGALEKLLDNEEQLKALTDG